MSVRTYQVAIVGGGMVGATLACLLAEQGVSVALIDAGDPAEAWSDDSYDLRVSALTLASMNLFKSFGVWGDIVRLGEQPMEKMYVWDHFASGELAIDSADAGEMQMGSVVENRVTVLALWEKLQALDACDTYTSTQLDGFDIAEKNVDIQLSNGDHINASLLVGADGSNSKIRQLSDIPTYGWSYQQKALVATVKPEQSHDNTAWQRFLPEGPLALLPLRNGLVSIVWTSKPETTEANLALSNADFCDALAEASEYKLGGFELMGARGGFPLKLQFSTEYCQQRMVLVGDAIHTIHPLAGQGANLGLQDAMGLAKVILKAHESKRDIASQQVLRRYERQRKGDNLIMMGMMDGFKRLFGTDETLIKLTRSTGMGLVNQSALLKNKICQYAMGV
ncbi:MAG: UbiH/UbiF/VisC/COQ6 family ubiquinone biosynthesis hydroxylase [Cycloclasticus sp.]|nr:UbiH/UbiF/VisC/COQ6 family ubiquinone biosynthesis hydroxylase [Cycloclasticus sp.]